MRVSDSGYGHQPGRAGVLPGFAVLQRIGQLVCVSATPAPYELEHAGQVVEQIIRPTGLLDPEIEVRPAAGQVDDLYAEIVKTTGEGYRVLVTTLTKKMAESLTTYLSEMNVKVQQAGARLDALIARIPVE